jgi:hypothetical protein
VVQGSDRMLYACMIICRCSEGGWTPQGRFLALLLDFDGHQKYSRWAPAGFPESPQLSRNFDGLYFIFENQFWGLRYSQNSVLLSSATQLCHLCHQSSADTYYCWWLITKCQLQVTSAVTKRFCIWQPNMTVCACAVGGPREGHPKLTASYIPAPALQCAPPVFRSQHTVGPL